MVSDIPVANGKIIMSFIEDRPIIFWSKFKVIDLLSWTTRLDPIALGYRALTSPLLPIPWPREKFFYLTIGEKMRASRSPTPQFPLKLFESIKATLFISSSIVSASKGSLGMHL